MERIWISTVRLQVERGSCLNETFLETYRGEVMRDKVGTFCEIVHEKLDVLEGRIDSLKLEAIATTRDVEAVTIG